MISTRSFPQSTSSCSSFTTTTSSPFTPNSARSPSFSGNKSSPSTHRSLTTTAWTSSAIKPIVPSFTSLQKSLNPSKLSKTKKSSPNSFPKWLLYQTSGKNYSNLTSTPLTTSSASKIYKKLLFKVMSISLTSSSSILPYFPKTKSVFPKITKKPSCWPYNHSLHFSKSSKTKINSKPFSSKKDSTFSSHSKTKTNSTSKLTPSSSSNS